MYQIGTILVDTRTDRMCHIENIVPSRKGTLYTVQYETGEFRRYYSGRLDSLFQLATIDRSNVIQVDFVLKRLVS